MQSPKAFFSSLHFLWAKKQGQVSSALFQTPTSPAHSITKVSKHVFICIASWKVPRLLSQTQLTQSKEKCIKEKQSNSHKHVGFMTKKHQKLQKRNIQVKICNLQRIGVSKATWAGTNQRSEFQARHAALTFGCMCVCEPVCVPFLVTAVSVLSSVQDLLTSCNFSIQFQNVFDTYFTWLFGIKSTSMKE